MIDIIIPCHNSHKTLDRCIGSILMQTEKDNIKVSLVNDGGEDYSELIERYSPILNIQEIGYEDNDGPGKARNYGIRKTKEEYIMFIDSDDALANPFVVHNLKTILDKKKDVMFVISDIMEEVEKDTLKIHKKNENFTHGKMYRRSYLKKNKISFDTESYCCEDMSFNILCFMLLNKQTENFFYFPTTTYFWLYNDNSIGRTDRLRYENCVCFRGFVDNLIYLYKELDKHPYPEFKVIAEKTRSMIKCCLYCSIYTLNYPDGRKENEETLKLFYDEIYSKIEDKVSDKLFYEMYKLLPFDGEDETNLKNIKHVISLLRK